MTKSEEIARKTLQGDAEAITTFTKMIATYQSEAKPIFLALRLLWKDKNNDHVGNLAWEQLKLLTEAEDRDPYTLASLLVLLALYQPTSLTGAARLVFPKAPETSLIFETLIQMRNLVADTLEREAW